MPFVPAEAPAVAHIEYVVLWLVSVAKAPSTAGLPRARAVAVWEVIHCVPHAASLPQPEGKRCMLMKSTDGRAVSAEESTPK